MDITSILNKKNLPKECLPYAGAPKSEGFDLNYLFSKEAVQPVCILGKFVGQAHFTAFLITR